MAKFTFDTTKIKSQIEENPLIAAGIGAALINATAKLMQANTDRKRAKIWNVEVNRRDRQSKK